MNNISHALIEELKKAHYTIHNHTNIQHGFQVRFSKNQDTGVLRIFHNKKHGWTFDDSLLQANIKDELHDIRERLLSMHPKSFSEVLNTRPRKARKIPHQPTHKQHISTEGIGTDESGKGDYFGPLVVAGVYLTTSQAKDLKALGVQDSKKLTDRQCKALAHSIKKLPHDIVVIRPERYNTLHAQIKNLNILLAWAHVRVIENLLKRVDSSTAIVDQFGSKDLIEKRLMQKGRNIQIIQEHRAEHHIAVASASVLARACFLEQLESLSQSFKIALPKGAYSRVIHAGQEFVKQHGQNALHKIAKYHFKTTQHILKR